MTNVDEPLNLTITFSPTIGEATVRWEAEILGVRTSRFTSPYQGIDLALVMHALDVLQDPHYPRAWTEEQQRHFHFDSEAQSRLARLGLWSDNGHVVADAPRRIGRALYQAFIADAAGAQALGTVRDHATASNRPVALMLRFPPDGVELAGLPWELLWDDGPAPLLLSQARSAACTRHLDLPQALPPPRDTPGPLRIVAIAPHARIPAALRQVERVARLNAWKPLLDKGLAVMEEISPATRLDLFRMLQGSTPPDIVHFYGHGCYTDGHGALLLDRPDGGQVWTGTSTLATLFGGARMVVLHACQGAMVSTNNSDDPTHGSALLTGVAPALSAAGVPIVMGMQFSIRTEAATRTSAAIYRALAQGQSVQQAVGQARHLLYIAEDDHASWYVPVIYIRSYDTGPVYLTRRPTTLHPGRPAMLTLERGATQVITARGQGQVQAVRMHGSSGAQQQISANQGGCVSETSMRAHQASQQQIEASDHGTIADVQLDDQA